MIVRLKVFSGGFLKRVCKCAEKRLKASACSFHVVNLPGVEMRLFYMKEPATSEQAVELANRAMRGELPGVDLL